MVLPSLQTMITYLKMCHTIYWVFKSIDKTNHQNVHAKHKAGKRFLTNVLLSTKMCWKWSKLSKIIQQYWNNWKKCQTSLLKIVDQKIRKASVKMWEAVWKIGKTLKNVKIYLHIYVKYSKTVQIGSNIWKTAFLRSLKSVKITENIINKNYEKELKMCWNHSKSVGTYFHTMTEYNFYIMFAFCLPWCYH